MRRTASGSATSARLVASPQRTLSAMATIEPASACRRPRPAAARHRAAPDPLGSRRERSACRPHVTVLFPFLAAGPTWIADGSGASSPAIAAAIEPFEVRFARVGRFPTRRLPRARAGRRRSRRLTAEIAARFPDHPPYGGAFEEVIPHLTVVESATRPLWTRSRWRPRGHLPFRHRVTMLEVLVAGRSEGRWHGRWRLPPRIGQTVMSSRCSPQATRRRSLISPTVA